LSQRRKVWTLIAVTVAVIVVGGLVVAFHAGLFAPSPKAATVRVGWLTGDLHQLAYFVAKNRTVGGGKSFFEKYNLNLTDAAPGGYINGPTMMDAFAAGKVDIGLLGSTPAITKHLNAQVNTTIVGQCNEIGSALITKHPISNLNDLKGKTIATPGPGTIQYFLLLRLAEKEGVGIGNFTLIQLAPGDMRVAMEAGRIDAFIAWEPYCADAVVNNVGVIYKNSSDIWPNHLCCIVAVHKTFAVNNPDIVINFLKAHIEATSWINKAKASGLGSADYNLLIDIAVNFTGRSPAVIERALGNINYKFDVDDRFMGCFIDFTYKLIQYGIVAPNRIEALGYRDVYEFANKYVSMSYLTEAKRT